MTPKQEVFCRYYVKTKNGTQAAIEAGYSKKTVRNNVSRMMANEDIKQRIYNLTQQSYELNNITEKNLKEELATIAYSNMNNYLKWKTTKKVNQVTGHEYNEFESEFVDSDEVDTRAIKEFSLDRFGSVKLKLYDKINAVDKLLSEIKYKNQIAEDEDDFYQLDNIRVNKHFEKWFFEDYKNPKYLYHILKGGRGSGKSTTAARALVCDILEYPINVLVVRKIHSTLLESCYEDIKQAINDLGVSDEFRCVSGPNFYIRRKRTGQKFIFRGGVEPEKIKSIKTSRYPIARLWVEEPTEFKQYEELKVIFDSVVRATLDGGMSYKVILTYNPPKQKGAWTNKLYNTQFIPENVFVDHSTSFDNPHLSEDFLKEAENVKINNESRYRWNYLGDAIGGGIVPFSNLTFRKIADDEIKIFDNILQGIDWGFAKNPAHHTRMHFNEKKRKLFIFGEINKIKCNDEKLAKLIVKNGWNDILITCDSEDPKAIANIKAFGCRSRGAKKGSGSVEHGLEWLDSLDEIVIDPKRCPVTAKNFEAADYKVDKTGEILSELDRSLGVDAIDAVRYATEHKQYSKRKFF